MNKALTVFIVASLSFSSPAASHAQLGSMIKKKVKEAVSKPETPKPEPAKPATSAANSASPFEKDGPIAFGYSLVEITQPNFDIVMSGVRKEIDAQAVLKKEIARYGTRNEYEACKVRVGESPEGKKAMEPMYNPPKDIKPEDYLKIQSKAVNDMDALTNKYCPLNPAYWSPGRRGQSLDSIRTEVALAISPANAPRSIDEQKYGVALERIDRLCRYKGFGPDNAKAEGNSPLKFPGVGSEIYWIYTEAEVEALNAARCKEYYALIARLMT